MENVSIKCQNAVNVSLQQDEDPGSDKAELFYTLTGKTCGILVFSHLRWKFVWQRPQQFLSRFAEDHPILFVEEPVFDLETDDVPRVELEDVYPNVTTLTLHVPREHTQEELADWRSTHLAKAVRGRDRQDAFELPVLWYYNPMDASWSLDRFSARVVVYDCMDELSLFAGAPPSLIEEERRLMQRADIVFAGGKELCQSKKQQHHNVHFFGCGVEYQHFARAQECELAVPADVRSLPHPIVGWFGVIDERMNYELLAKMADLRPEWSFVLVGPVVKVNPATLPQRPNLHWIGSRDYAELPDYCRAFDICMMPFALNDATKFINPTKALEYLATARPVVSTPVADVVAQYSDTVFIAESGEAFVQEIDQLLQEPPRERIARGIERAQACSWEFTVASMRTLIQASMKQPN